MPQLLRRPKSLHWKRVLNHVWAENSLCTILELLWFQGVNTRQHDAFSIGLTTTDVFQNADVLYEDTLPAIKAALTRPPGAPKAVPIVTGFLGRGINTGTSTASLAHVQHLAASRDVLDMALGANACLPLRSGDRGVLQLENLMLGKVTEWHLAVPKSACDGQGLQTLTEICLTHRRYHNAGKRGQRSDGHSNRSGSWRG